MGCELETGGLEGVDIEISFNTHLEPHLFSNLSDKFKYPVVLVENNIEIESAPFIAHGLHYCPVFSLL